MTTRKEKPPRPPGKGQGRRVEGEDELLAAWRPRIEAYARRVPARSRRRLGMDWSDVVQDLTLSMLREIRRHHRKTGELAPGRLLTVVIRRRVSILNRDSRVMSRQVEDAVRSSWSEDPIDIVDPAPSRPDEELTQAELEEACQALVYAIRENVPPAAFAILHLRHVDELTPTEIAKMLGDAGVTNKRASKRVGYAKGVAAAFLQSLGIHTLDDVLRAHAEVSDE